MMGDSDVGIEIFFQCHIIDLTLLLGHKPKSCSRMTIELDTCSIVIYFDCIALLFY